jgi:hypothetical protein
MHDLSTETLITKYTLRGVARDPITAGTVMAAGYGVSAIGSLIGGEMSASGTEQAGQLKAQQLGMQATESRAAGQRQMFEQQRKARLALSTLRARASMTGSGQDTDTIKIAGDIGNRGDYLALAEMYTGENRARGLEDEASATIWSSKAKAKATRVGSYFSAASSILKGVGSAGGKGGGDGASLPDTRTLDDMAYG